MPGGRMIHAYYGGIRYDFPNSAVVEGWSASDEAGYRNLKPLPRAHRLNDPGHDCIHCMLFREIARRKKSLRAVESAA